MSTVKIGFVNAKGGVTNNAVKSMAPSDDRITNATHFWNRLEVTIAAYAEFNKAQFTRLQDQHPHWDVHHATWNKVTRTGAIGNGIAWRHNVWRPSSFDEIVVKNTHSNYVPPIEDLHLPVAVMEHLDTKQVVTFIGCHFPAGHRPLIVTDRERCAQMVLDYAAGVKSPLVVLGDFNAGTLPPLTTWPGGQDTIDHIRLRGLAAKGSKQLPEFHQKVTDHRGGVMVEAELPARK